MYNRRALSVLQSPIAEFERHNCLCDVGKELKSSRIIIALVQGYARARTRRATMQSAADHFRIWQTHLFAYSLSYTRYDRHTIQSFMNIFIIYGVKYRN